MGCLLVCHRYLIVLVDFSWQDVDPTSVLVKVHAPLDQRKDRVIVTHADVLAGVPFGTALAYQDVPGNDVLTTVLLDPASLCGRVTTVAAGSLSLLMSHRLNLRSKLRFLQRFIEQEVSTIKRRSARVL